MRVPLASSPVQPAKKKTFLCFLNLLFVFCLPSFAKVAGLQLQIAGGHDRIEILIRTTIVFPSVLNLICDEPVSSQLFERGCCRRKMVQLCDVWPRTESCCAVNDLWPSVGQQPHLYEQRRSAPKSPHLLARAGGEGESITLSLSAARVITAG